MSTPRLDKITPGSVVTLQFHEGAGQDSYEDTVLFLGVEGSGNERRAKFMSQTGGTATYTWEAYRYNGRWAYGTSADRLSVICVDKSLREVLR